ncbi:hypothetical protein MY11210_009171 [Beauveria gryllotalpidicola]
MASLRYILNDVVDDNSQPRPASGSSAPTPVPHSSTRYPASSDLPMHHPSSANYLCGDSPHNAYSRTPECSASRQHIPLPAHWRDSTGTNEPTTYSSSHAQSYAAGQDMPGNVMRESGVKQTPITGRTPPGENRVSTPEMLQEK